ncbi:MAG: hypothetical protein WBZ57_20240 [Pseudomonas graminis]
MSSSIVTPPASELNTVQTDPPHTDFDVLFPDPARVPPYITAVEAASFERKPLGQVEVSIIPMTAAHAEWWHGTMQPFIKSGFRTAKEKASEHPGKKIRADVHWNWNRWFWLLNLHNRGHLSTRDAHPAFGLVMEVRTPSGERVPIGMMTLVPRYLCNSDRFGSKTYTWFISSAPEAFYRECFQELKLDGVGKALFDAAIIASYRAGLDGSLLLHADPKGGRSLTKLYEDFGFQSIGLKVLPITLHRWFDRRGYMLLSAKGAAHIIRENDEYRRKGYVAD